MQDRKSISKAPLPPKEIWQLIGEYSSISTLNTFAQISKMHNNVTKKLFDLRDKKYHPQEYKKTEAPSKAFQDHFKNQGESPRITRLFQLIKENDLAKIIVEKYSWEDLLLLDNQKISATFWALKLSKQSILDYFYSQEISRFMIDGKLNVKLQDGYGMTVLHWACYCNQPIEYMEKEILSQKPNINKKTTIGTTAIVIAIKNRNKIILKFLLQHNPDMNMIVNKDGDTALKLAEKKGFRDIAKILVRLTTSSRGLFAEPRRQELMSSESRRQAAGRLSLKSV